MRKTLLLLFLGLGAIASALPLSKIKIDEVCLWAGPLLQGSTAEMSNTFNTNSNLSRSLKKQGFNIEKKSGCRFNLLIETVMNDIHDDQIEIEAYVILYDDMFDRAVSNRRWEYSLYVSSKRSSQELLDEAFGATDIVLNSFYEDWQDTHRP